MRFGVVDGVDAYFAWQRSRAVKVDLLINFASLYVSDFILRPVFEIDSQKDHAFRAVIVFEFIPFHSGISNNILINFNKIINKIDISDALKSTSPNIIYNLSFFILASPNLEGKCSERSFVRVL